MATTVRTLVAGQNTTVGAVSSRSLHTITVATGGIPGNDGVSVTAANVASGNLILTLSNSASIDAGPVGGAAANLSGYQTTAGLSANVATLTANNTSFVGSISAANVVSNSQLASNLANYATTSSLSSYQTTAGLSANVAALTSNNTSFVGSVSAANVVSNAQLSSNLANYQTTAGLSANVATLTSNNTLYLDGIAANQYAYANATVSFNNITTGIPRLPANSASNVFGVLAGNGGRVGATFLDTSVDKVRVWNSSNTGWITLATTTDVDSITADRLTSNGYTAVLQANGVLTLANGLNTSVNNSVTINTSRQQFEWVTSIAGSGVNTFVANTTSNSNVLSITTEWTVQVGLDVYNITSIATDGGSQTATMTIPGLTVVEGVPYIFRNPTPVPKAWEFDKTGTLTLPGSVVFSDNTVQTTAFTKDYDTLTTGFPRIPRSTATNAIHAVDISTVNTNRDGIVYYDTGDSRVRMYANGTGWYTFATTADVAAVDRLTSNGHTVVLGTDGILTAPGEVYGQYFSLRGGNANGTIGSLGYGGDVVDLYGSNGVTITTAAPEGGPQWRFGTTGVLTTSGNGTIATTNTGSNTSMKIAVHWNDPSASPAVNHATSVWTFQHGSITFPDNTVQSTAFTGNATNASLLGGIAADQYTTYEGSYSWTNTHVFSNTIQISTIRGVHHDAVGSIVTGVPMYSGAGSNAYVWMSASLSNTNTQAVIAYGDITGWTITAEDNPSVTATVTSMSPVGYWGVGTSAPLAYSAGRTFKFISPDYAAAYVQSVSVNVSSNTWTFNSNGALTFPDSTLQSTAFNVANAYTFSGVHTHTANVILNAATTISGNATAAFGNVTINGTLTATGNITGNTAGFTIGYLDVPQNYTNTSFTLALSDRGKHIYTSNGTSQTITIANNSTVAFPVGSAITIVSQGAGTITVARGTGVSLYLAANSTSADRTISTYGVATLLKVAVDTWFISGAGVA